MIEILKSILFGIVQGITEWLPISSTGHMILLNEFVTLNVTPEFWEMFKVVIQFGSILAVVLIFWGKLFPFEFKSKDIIKKDVMQMWFKVVVGCIPAGLLVVFGLDEVCDAMFQNYLTVAVMLILFGVLFIVIENRNKNIDAKISEISLSGQERGYLECAERIQALGVEFVVQDTGWGENVDVAGGYVVGAAYIDVTVRGH